MIEESRSTRILFLCAFLSVVVFFLSVRQPRYISKNIIGDELFSSKEDREIWGALSDFCVKDGYLYLLFDNQDVLKVYDTNGSFVCTFAHRYYQGGRNQLHINQDYVLWEDEQHNIYVFSYGEWIDFIKWPGIDSYRQQQKEYALYDGQMKQDSNGEYHIRSASIYCMDKYKTDRLIVKRPVFMILFQGVLWLLVPILMFATVVSKMIQEKMKN